MADKDLLDEIANRALLHYRESGDFNGLNADTLCSEMALGERTMRGLLGLLLDGDLATLTFASIFENPYIKAIDDLPIEEQRRLLEESALDSICVYPSNSRLAISMDESAAVGKPFIRMLHLGVAQLKPVAFESQVLDRYLQDPRYSVGDDGTSMFIRIRGEYDEDAETPERDKINLRYVTTGVGEDGKRLTVGLVRYLADLTSEHQQHWESYRYSGRFKIDSDFLRRCFGAEFTETRSVYDAFLQEEIEINRLCEMIGKPPLFKRTFEGEGRPEGFRPLTRPTSESLEQFIHLMDKLISENMNRDFFTGDVDLKERQDCRNGAIKEIEKGSLRLLQEWVGLHYATKDPAPLDQMLQIFKSIRKERQPSAHQIRSSDHDEAYWEKQNKYIVDAYYALRTLRTIFNSHPMAKGYRAPEWLEGYKIKV